MKLTNNVVLRESSSLPLSHHLTHRNYYSKKANQAFLSVSQYKEFIGTTGKCGCEARALAKLKGKYIEEPSKDMLLGSYLDAAYEGKLYYFKKKHPEMFLKTGALKVDYKKAHEAWERTKKDRLFQLYMSGQKQVIMTARLWGANWKIKMDSYHAGKCIVDLKYIKDIHERFWVKDLGYYVNFIENWGYDLQLAIYQKVVEQNIEKKLPCYIAVVDKKPHPEIELIQLEQDDLDRSLVGIEANVKRILELKEKKDKPIRCNKCPYCVQTKVLKYPIKASGLIEI